MASEQGSAGEGPKKYSWEEVAKHNNTQSLWIVVDGKVYDVTEFMEEVSLC